MPFLMGFLAAAFIPLPPATSGGDSWIAVVAIVAFAIAAAVALVVANRPMKPAPKPAIKEAPRTILPTAA